MRRFIQSIGLGLRVGLVLAATSGIAQESKPTPTSGIVQRVRDGAGAVDAVVVEDSPLLHTAQLLPLDAAGKLVGAGDVSKQFDQLLANLAHLIANERGGLANVAKLNLYVADNATGDVVRRDLAKRIAAGQFGDGGPAVSYVATRLPIAEARVALDAVVALQKTKLSDHVVGISKDDRVYRKPGHLNGMILPVASRIYIAGQAEKGDLREATRKTLASLHASLKHLGLDWDDVVQFKSFVTPMANVADAEDEFRKAFGDQPVPPLVWVEWKSGLPIEIELIASARDRSTVAAAPGAKLGDLEYLTPPGMTTPTIYSRVARMHGPATIYIGGLYGAAGENGEQQVERIFARLQQVLAQTDSDLRHLAKATYYVSNDDASTKLNELRPKYYDPKRPPAASKAMVESVGLDGRSITIDMIAGKKLPK